MANSEEVLGQNTFSANVGDTIRVTGNFIKSDGTTQSGLPVKIVEDNHTTSRVMATGTTDSNGNYSIDCTLTLEGSAVNIYAYVGEDVDADGWWGNVTVAFDSISLSSDKSILSYSDHEYATLTAQLKSNGNNATISGQTVSFKIYDDEDTLLDTLTGTTNSNGQCSVSYHSQHSGNIYIKATTSNIFSNNIQIEYISYYNSLTSQINDFEVTSGYSTLTYSSNGLTVFTPRGGNSFITNTGYELPNNFILEFTITGLIFGDYNATGGICVNDYFFEKTANGTIIVRRSDGAVISTIDCFDENTVIKIIQENSTMQIYKNDVLKYTLADTVSSQYFEIKSYANRGITIKDLKIREL